MEWIQGASAALLIILNIMLLYLLFNMHYHDISISLVYFF